MSHQMDETNNIVLIRANVIYALAGGAGFALVGLLMMNYAPPQSAVLPWSKDIQELVGLLAIIFGIIGMSAATFVGLRPILILGPDGITLGRNWRTIHYSDIRVVSAARQSSGKPLQWIELTMVDPQKYASLERWPKQNGFSTADLVLDLSLAHPKVYQKARKIIMQQVKEAAGE